MMARNKAMKKKPESLHIYLSDTCNLRCIYCMPKEGVKPKPRSDILTYQEIEFFARCAASVGISKIRLTGGEPLVRKGIAKLVCGLSHIPNLEDISLTTNGILLKDRAEALADAGLGRVNISLDSLEPEVYRRLTRGGDVEKVLEGVKAALQAGLNPVKMLTSNDPATDRYQFALTTLRRELPRILEALDTARERAEALRVQTAGR